MANILKKLLAATRKCNPEHGLPIGCTRLRHDFLNTLPFSLCKRDVQVKLNTHVSAGLCLFPRLVKTIGWGPPVSRCLKANNHPHTYCSTLHDCMCANKSGTQSMVCVVSQCTVDSNHRRNRRPVRPEAPRDHSS